MPMLAETATDDLASSSRWNGAANTSRRRSATSSGPSGQGDTLGDDDELVTTEAGHGVGLP